MKIAAVRPLAVLSLFASLALIGCSAAGVSGVPGAEEGDSLGGSAGQVAPRSAEQILVDLGIEASDPKAMVEALDLLPVDQRPTDLIASVLPDHVKLQPGQPGEISLPLGDDAFYLSIAPFVSQTHPCTFHSLTTCLGELQNTPITLTVTDKLSGEVLLSEGRATADNGFTGVWLPRDGEYLVEVESEHGAGSQVVTTGNEDPTCLTTLQLT